MSDLADGHEHEEGRDVRSGEASDRWQRHRLCVQDASEGVHRSKVRPPGKDSLGSTTQDIYPQEHVASYMCSRRRRDLLALAGTTATALAAGCLSTNDGSAPTTGELTDSTTTRDDAPETTADPDGPTASVDGDFDASAWLPAPTVLQTDAYFAFVGDVTAPGDAGVPEAARERTRDAFVGLPGDVFDRADVVEVATAQGIGCVCTFDADTSTVQDRLATVASNSGGPGGGGDATATASEGTETGSYGTTRGDSGTATSTGSAVIGDAPDGYVGYATLKGVYWLGADHVLYGRREGVVRAMYDARAGNLERYASNRDVTAVRDAAADADLVAFARRGQEPVPDASAYAYGWRFGDSVELVAPFAFPDAASTDADVVAGLADLAGFAEYEPVDVAVDGRVVTLTGELPLAEFDLLERDDGGEKPGGRGGTTPQVAFQFEFEPGDDSEWNGDDEERVVLTHTGGDNVDVAAVNVQYDGTAVADRNGFTSTKPTGDAWTAGGEWTIRATGADASFESDATLRVVWTTEDGSQSAVLAEAVLP
jgi:hypothetical protein